MFTIVRSRNTQVHRRIVALVAGAVAVLAISGCHKKKVAPPPPPPPPASAPAPTANITAEPASVNSGQAVVLTWNTTDANSAEIEGVGQVPTAGTKTVNPTESTTYTLTATGDGGSATATARVTVNAGPTQSNLSEGNITDEQFHQDVKDIFYDYDSYSIRPDAQAAAQQDATFLNQHPELKVVVGGYCDERGSTEYNLALGENRANAAKQALVADGVSPQRLRTVSYGKEKQFCTEHNEACWQQNRRAAFSIDR